FRHEHRRTPCWRYSPRHADCGRHQLRRRQKPRRNRPRLREVADSRTGRRRGGQGYRLDCRRQRPENEGEGLSAPVRPAEFLLLCNDGIQHPASSRRTAWKAGLPRPGQLALGRLDCPLACKLPVVNAIGPISCQSDLEAAKKVGERMKKLSIGDVTIISII